MITKKSNKKALVMVPVAAGLLGAGVLLGYANYPKVADGWDLGGARPPRRSPGAKAPVNTDPAVNGASVAKAEARAARRPAAST